MKTSEDDDADRRAGIQGREVKSFKGAAGETGPNTGIEKCLSALLMAFEISLASLIFVVTVEALVLSYTWHLDDEGTSAQLLCALWTGEGYLVRALVDAVAWSLARVLCCERTPRLSRRATFRQVETKWWRTTTLGKRPPN